MTARPERSRALPASSLAIAALVFVGAVLAGVAEPPLSTVGKVIVAAGALAQAVVVFVTDRRKRAADRLAATAQDDLRIAIDDTLAPLVKNLRDLVGQSESARRRSAMAFAVAVAGAARAMTTAGRVRVSVFLRDDDCFFAPRELTVGRGDRPVSRFCRDTPEGEDVWRAAINEETRFCADTAVDPPPGWDPSRARGYRTFITVPIVTKGEVQGLLTLNAPQPGDLDETSVGMLQVLAGMLGTAFALPGGTPDVDEA